MICPSSRRKSIYPNLYLLRVKQQPKILLPAAWMEQFR